MDTGRSSAIDVAHKNAIFIVKCTIIALRRCRVAYGCATDFNPDNPIPDITTRHNPNPDIIIKVQVMADTLDAISIPSTWTDINTLSGIPAGTQLILQNVGSANDVIDLAISATEPAVGFEGVELFQNSFFGVDAGENTVWARYKRADRADVGTRLTKLQVQI